jgi:hypothetical protein
MDNNNLAYEILTKRGVTRLCHFTKVNSLIHILSNENGILATDYINADVKNQNDKQRLYNATDYVCCSLQYPNSWYWDKAKKRDIDQIFKKWVVLAIDLSVVRERKFKFCPVNAAKGNGNCIRNDVVNIADVYASSVNNRQRSLNMLDCCPTDDQAEILIHKMIPLRFLNRIIVGDKSSANHVFAITKTVGISTPVYVSQEVCNTDWSKLIRNGEIPQEIEYKH